jgi:hypothetical protein
MKQIRNGMEALLDSRIGSNTQYEMSDVALSAFSTFFMQSPSFLAQKRTLQKQKEGAMSILCFGAYAIYFFQINNFL